MCSVPSCLRRGRPAMRCPDGLCDSEPQAPLLGSILFNVAIDKRVCHGQQLVRAKVDSARTAHRGSPPRLLYGSRCKAAGLMRWVYFWRVRMLRRRASGSGRCACCQLWKLRGGALCGVTLCAVVELVVLDSEQLRAGGGEGMSIRIYVNNGIVILRVDSWRGRSSAVASV